MKLQRDWVTPITMGAFGVLAVTGVLMFFHVKTALVEGVHEWLSWLLLAAVVGHAAVNWTGLRRHLAGWRARAALGIGAAVLAAAVLPIGPSGGKPPFVVPVQALADAPLPVLAQVAKTSPEQLRQRLRDAGLGPAGDADTVHSLAGNDLGRQMRVLSAVLKTPGG
jgi:hypothetical protein